MWFFVFHIVLFRKSILRQQMPIFTKTKYIFTCDFCVSVSSGQYKKSIFIQVLTFKKIYIFTCDFFCISDCSVDYMENILYKCQYKMFTCVFVSDCSVK